MTTRLRRVSLLLIGAQLLSITAPAFAAPMGGSVASGAVVIDQAGNLTQVRQSTDRAIINWQGFSTKAHETVKFQAPSSAAVTLNRVVSGEASSLAGSLQANGKVFLVNPNGIVFAPTSRVNAGGLVASTLAISDADFKRGHYQFRQAADRPLASVVNHGHIEAAPGGTVALVAPVVDNRGTIVAPGGRVALAAGTSAHVDLDSGLVNLQATGAPPRDVVYGTDGHANPLADVVNNRALAEAGAVEMSQGRVMLRGAEGTVLQAGRIVTDGPSGGSVHLSSTQKTTLAAGSVTSANATAAGGIGGTIHVLSQARAVTAPTSLISARGGRGGRGGFVDVSAKRIAVDGDVDTRADAGKTGTFLIDPEVLTIVNASGDLDDDIVPPVLAPAGPVATLPGTASGSQLSVARINALAIGNDIVLEATSAIVFDNTAPIEMSGHSLTLKVVPTAAGGAGDVQVNTSTSVTGALDFNLIAGTADHPGATGIVDLTGLTVHVTRDINIDVVAATSSKVVVQSLNAPNGTITINALKSSIRDATPALGDVNLVATNLVIKAQDIAGDSVFMGSKDVDVSVRGTMELTADRRIFLHNIFRASQTTLNVTGVSSDDLDVRQDGFGLSSNATGGITLQTGADGANLALNLTGLGQSIDAVSIDTGAGNLSLATVDGSIGGVVKTSGKLDLTALGGTVDVENTGATASALSVVIAQFGDNAVKVRQQAGDLLSTNGLSLTPSSQSVSVRTRFGDISIGELDAGAGDVVLHAESGGVRGVNAGSKITAGNLSVAAASVFGDVASPLQVSATGTVTLNVTDFTSAIHAKLLNAPELLDIKMRAPGLTVEVTDATGLTTLRQSSTTALSTPVAAGYGLAFAIGDGNLATGNLDVGTHALTLAAPNGSLITASDALLTAGTMKLSAAGTLGDGAGAASRIDAGSLALTFGSTARVVEATGLALDASTIGGDLELKALLGDISFASPTTIGRAGTFEAASALGQILTGATGSVAAGGSLSFSAANGIDVHVAGVGEKLSFRTGDGPAARIVAQLNALPNTLTIHEGSARLLQVLDAASSLVLSRVTGGTLSSKTALNANLELTLDHGDLALGAALGTVALSLVGVTGGVGGTSFARNLVLTASDGAIRVADGQQLEAESVTLHASGDIAGVLGAAGTHAGSIQATSDRGSVRLAEKDAVTLGAGTAAGDYTVTAGGDIDVTGGLAAGKVATLTAAKGLSVGGAVTGGTSVDLTAGGDIELQKAVSAGAFASLKAGGDIRDTPLVASLITGPAVQLTAQNIGSAARGLKVATSHLSASATAGNVFILGLGDLGAHDVDATGVVSLAATGGIAVGTVVTGSGVRLDARGGAITDANGPLLNLSSKLPGGAFLSALSGIGSLADPLDTQVALIEATAVGDIGLSNSGHVVLTALARSGDVAVTVNSGWIVLNTVRAFGGDVSLTAPQGGLLDNDRALFDVIAQRLTLVLGATAGTPDATLDTRVNELSADAFGVYVDNRGALRVPHLVSTSTSLLRATGDVVLGRLESTAGAIDVVSTGGSIFDGNGSAVNLVTSGGLQSRLIASGTIGATDAIEVAMGPGSLAVAADGSVGGVSARIEGSVAPDDTVLSLGTADSVLFNGRIAAVGDGDPARRVPLTRRQRAALLGRGSNETIAQDFVAP